MSSPELLKVSTPNNQTSGAVGRNNFDFCRFWLAVMVIFSHSFSLAVGNEHDEPLKIITRGQISFGHFAVCCFFAISGFLITHSWLRSSSVAIFLMKRVLRIYPGFVIAVFIGLFVVAPLGSERFELTRHSLQTLPLKLLALRPTEPTGVFTNNPWPGEINGSLWTIPYEFKCYLGLMLMGSIGLLSTYKRTTIGLFVGVLVCCPVIWRAVPSLETGTFSEVIGSPWAWCMVLPFFAAGTTFYLIRHQVPFSSQWVAGTMIVLAVAARFPRAGAFVFPIGITYLLFWFSFHPSVKLQNWAHYGDFSYGIYLYSFPIQQLIAMRTPGISPIMLFLIATPLSVLAGVLSWHLIEKRFLKMKHRQSAHATATSG